VAICPTPRSLNVFLWGTVLGLLSGIAFWVTGGHGFVGAVAGLLMLALLAAAMLSLFIVTGVQAMRARKARYRIGPLGDGRSPLKALPGFGYWQRISPEATGTSLLQEHFVVSIKCPDSWTFHHCLRIAHCHPSSKMDDYSSTLLTAMLRSYLGRAASQQFESSSVGFKQTVLHQLFALPNLDFGTLMAGGGILGLHWFHPAAADGQPDDAALAFEIDLYRKALEAIVTAHK